MNQEITPKQLNKQLGRNDWTKQLRLWKRLSIITLAQHHIEHLHIARFLDCHIVTIRRWVGRFRNKETLNDKARTGTKPKFSEQTRQRVIAFFCQFETLPGYARWTLSTACQYFQDHPEGLKTGGMMISRASIHRLLSAPALKPHRYRYFLHLSDPKFFVKMEHIINVYASVAKNLFCFDECTGIQALEHLAPPVPVTPHRPEYREVEYIRHGAVSIFSVLELSSGQVFTEVIDNHTAATIIEVFKRHVSTVSSTETRHYICDNYSSHSTIEVCEAVGIVCGVSIPKLVTVDERRKWLGSTDKRIIFHFLPFHGSWLNLIENWFGIMKNNCHDGASVHSQDELSQNIINFTNTWNEQYAHPFKWTYEGKDLSGKTVRKFTYWLQEESLLMSGKFLGKQLELMTHLIHDDWDKIPEQNWRCLGSVIEAKQAYFDKIVESIDDNIFKDTKAKTPEERENKISNKIVETKQMLRQQINRFQSLIQTSLASISNCEYEPLN